MSRRCSWGIHRWMTQRIWTSKTPQILGHGPGAYWHKEEKCDRCGLVERRGSNRKFRRVKT